MSTIDATELRRAYLARTEIALLDLRDEHDFAQGHPLFAANLPLASIEAEAAGRVPRPSTPVVVYDDGEGLAALGAERLRALGFTDIRVLRQGLEGWRAAGLELFRDVNSYSKAFGELVEACRNTPSIAAPELKGRIDRRDDIVVLDARRFDEFHNMSIPSARSAPGAELLLRATAAVQTENTVVVVNCAGRTRSIIGAQSLINARFPNPVVALRNGTIGWTLADQALEQGRSEVAPAIPLTRNGEAATRARSVAYRAGVKHLTIEDAAYLARDTERTLYRFDVRQPEEYRAGHIAGFRNAPGGQLVQETDHFAPVRGARILLADDRGVRADMTGSWLSQMGWETYVIEGGRAGVGDLEQGDPLAVPPRSPAGRYKRPYEGTDNALDAMQAYLDWEFGLVDQLTRDGTHGFFVI